jgi:hypothetical protein
MPRIEKRGAFLDQPIERQEQLGARRNVLSRRRPQPIIRDKTAIPNQRHKARPS